MTVSNPDCAIFVSIHILFSVDVGILSQLKDMGFIESMAVEALKQSDNDLHKALEVRSLPLVDTRLFFEKMYQDSSLIRTI